jgi:predicted GNAT family N-acyltransferase
LGDTVPDTRKTEDGIVVRLALTPEDMDGARKLRSEVFVSEQSVPPEEETDEYDDAAFHAVALKGGRIVGTGRVHSLPSGETKIGRMAIEAGLRGRGIGGLVLGVLEEQAVRDGVVEVMLNAQSYVRGFYERHGYRVDGGPFLEVGIEHVRMVKGLRP